MFTIHKHPISAIFSLGTMLCYVLSHDKHTSFNIDDDPINSGGEGEGI